MILLLFVLIISIKAVDLTQPPCEKPYCLECDTQGKKCLSCMNYYKLDETTGECKYQSEDGCVSWSSSGQCQTCGYGYYFDFESRTCKIGKNACGTGIITENDKKCPQCLPGYSFGKTKCVDCREKNKHCIELDGSSDECVKCTKCQQGTELNPSNFHCDLKNEFCETFIENEQIKCKTCLPGYYPNTQGICVKGRMKNCKTYQSENECTSCFDGSFLKKGKCYQCPANCTTCEEVETIVKCKQCNIGFLYNETTGNCVSCMEGCSKCVTTDTCLQCTFPYSKNFNMDKCVLTQVEHCIRSKDQFPKQCDQCENEYLASGGKCLKCEGDCETCLYSTTYCTNCRDKNKQAINGQCVTPILHCSTYENGNCSSCVEGFNLVNNTCVSQGCSQYSEKDNTKCLSCNKNHYMTNTYECKPCGKMGLCSLGCIHSEDNCISHTSIHFCAIHKRNGECEECIKRYEIFEWQCLEIKDDCEVYSIDDKCVLCLKYENNGNELRYFPNKNGSCLFDPRNVTIDDFDNNFNNDTNTDSNTNNNNNNNSNNTNTNNTNDKPKNNSSQSIFISLIICFILMVW